MQVDITFIDALRLANVPEAAARAAAESLSREIDRRYSIHEKALMTKGDGEQIRTDLHKTINDQTWKIAGMMVALAAVLVAALKVAPIR